MVTEEKREPTVLDRLNNAVTPDRAVKKGLLTYAKSVMPGLLEDGFNQQVTKQVLHKKLTQWLYVNGFTGRGTKRLVDKTASKVMKGYESALKRRLEARARDLSKQGFWGEHQADAIRAQLALGKVGKSRDRWHRFR